jgi:predicted nicotinamide N-methyase
MSTNSEQVKILSGAICKLLNDGIDMVANGASLIPPECSLLIQSVKKRMGGHDDTGYIIWGASRLLSNLIYWGGAFFRKKSVLEIGAGLGLPGLLSAYFADKVWLTDFNLSVLHAAAYNIDLNKMGVSQKLANDGISAISHHAASKEGNKEVLRLIAAQLDWDKLDNQCELYSANSDDVNNTIRMDTSLLPKRHSVDVVIGADVVYCEEAAIGVVKSIKHFMAKDGLGIISATSSFTRFGIEFLPAAAARVGLYCQKIPVSELGMAYRAYLGGVDGFV